MLYHSCHAIDIADASSMQDAFHMNFVRSPLHISDGLLTSWYTALTVESLWLSGRASERGVLGSEIRFLMRTQNFFLVPRSWQDEKTSVSIIILFTHLLKLSLTQYWARVLSQHSLVSTEIFVNGPNFTTTALVWHKMNKNYLNGEWLNVLLLNGTLMII